MLHTDPLPGAFIHDDTTDETGLIDWAGARRGPLAAHEMQHLNSFRRFREAVQGAYFAGRIATNDPTGGIDHAENEKGLNDARRRLGVLGFDTA